MKLAIVEALNAAGSASLSSTGWRLMRTAICVSPMMWILVVRLSHDDIGAAFQALEQIDYRPANPSKAEDFANPAMREAWRREKGMRVLKILSDRHRENAARHFYL